MQEKPNILMIFTDQQRWDTLAAYGNTEIKTPNLDRLAQEGALFETAVTPCPLCMPARASVMTGKTNSALGCMENIYPRDVDNEKPLQEFSLRRVTIARQSEKCISPMLPTQRAMAWII